MRRIRRDKDYESLFPDTTVDESKGPRLQDRAVLERSMRMSKNHPLLEPNDILPDSAIVGPEPHGYYFILEMGRQIRLQSLLKQREIKPEPFTVAQIEGWCKAYEKGKPEGYFWQVPGLKRLIYGMFNLPINPPEPGEIFLLHLYHGLYNSYIITNSTLEFREGDVQRIALLCERENLEQRGFFDTVPGLIDRVNYFYGLNFKTLTSW